MQDALTTAIQMHRSGQLGPASQLYQKVLAREQENAEAENTTRQSSCPSGKQAKVGETARQGPGNHAAKTLRMGRYVRTGILQG